MPSARIDASQPCLTVLITIQVDDERREAFLEDIRRAVDEVVAPLPGFISASFHRRTDAPGCLNYAQWESQEAYQGFTQNAAVAERVWGIFARHDAHATIGRYEVLGTHLPPGQD